MIKVYHRKRQEHEDLSALAWNLLDEACCREGIEGVRGRIILGPNKKPYIDDNAIFFNLSHSGDYALCVLCDTEVGCDIQQIRKMRQSVLDRCFHSGEKAYILEGETEEERARRFTRIWVLRESYIKQTGEGLNRDLHTFYFSIEDNCPVLYIQTESEEQYVPAEIVFNEFPVGDCLCAVCYEPKKANSLSRLLTEP